MAFNTNGKLKTILLFSSILMSGAVLSSCGGGGDGSSNGSVSVTPPPTPTPTPTPTPPPPPPTTLSGLHHWPILKS